MGGVVCRGRVQCRPVKHRLFTILSALSLLLFVAVGVLWVRSYWVVDDVYSSKTDAQSRYVNSFRLTTHRGTILMETARPDSAIGLNEPPGRSFWYREAAVEGFVWPLRENEIRRVGGVSWGESRFVIGPITGYSLTGYSLGTANVLILPLGFVAAATSVSPLIWLAMRWKRRGSVAGLCPSCGYDLRATPDRCPECGLFPAAPPPPPPMGNDQ
jgi:uncharacterized membrane protein